MDGVGLEGENGGYRSHNLFFSWMVFRYVTDNMLCDGMKVSRKRVVGLWDRRNVGVVSYSPCLDFTSIIF